MTWLSVMEKAQRELEDAHEDEASGSPLFPFPLSTYMRDSWESGRFWLNYAARDNWAFDAIY